MNKKEFDDLTKLYFNCHNAISEIIKEDTGRYPKNYKKFEKKRINKFFENISYKAKNILDFSSDLMSELIAIHGLPNTNHRTTIFFISIILRKLGIKFPNYDSRKYKNKWIEDCNRYIAKSKRILYTRKKDKDYKRKHKEWTKIWLSEVIGAQSKSSGMMSRHLLNSFKKISSSDDLTSVIIKK